ncbi:MAG: hypothetical protein OEM52_05825, partial [bacterium]|nr:hypothetical protein [bacterium]
LLTSMETPIGRNIGNWLETREAIEWLQGRDDLTEVNELTLTLGAEVLDAVGKGPFDAAYQRLEQHWRSGRGLEIFAKIVAAQGGDPKVIEHPEIMPTAPVIEYIRAPRDGFLNGANALWFGKAGITLGAGRRVVSDTIDPLAGFRFLKSWGDPVEAGEIIAEIHGSDRLVAMGIASRASEQLHIDETAKPLASWIIQRYPQTRDKASRKG